MQPSPADMLLFAAVVREGSFTRAARQLGITKQTASQRVANLEARLGVRLLQRTTRNLRATDVGATYYERCAAISAQVEEANHEVQARHVEPVGLLRLSAPVLYGRRFLAPVIADFLAQYPKTRVDLVLADRRVHLIEEGFDLAIRVGRLDDSALATRKLGDGLVYYVASPAFVARHGAPRDPRSARCVGTRSFETWSLDGRTHKVEPVFVVNDLEIACDAAIAGVGIARLPSLVCGDAVAKGALRVLYGPESELASPICVVYPGRNYIPPKVRTFIDALVALGDRGLSIPRRAGRRSTPR